MNEPRLLLTPKEACTALGIGKSFLYQLLNSNTIPSIRLGRLVRIAVTDLQAFIDAKKLEGGE